ncbi:PspC domain-containing protein [Paenibacillus sp. MMS18-CY102]|uniref:PspC domain-containing protein n=1 Tax=Paenibacillus sp. MMS18-CY102 TaxID=2682849 RepID=UPI0013655EE0|nr:PspC domain-containing protein [Paenibacillus sp. MMS18-CY102]MWC31001.1 PspC domain-containing protein [Paenibacillus sp. MMS18-CY102]
MSKMYRSYRDKKLFGLCGGLAEWMGVDATLIRILMIVLAVFSGGVVIPIYILAAFVVPRDPYYGNPNYNPYGGYGNNQGQGNRNFYGNGFGQQPGNNGFNGAPFGGPNGHQAGGPYSNPPQQPPYGSTPPSSQLDSMMEDLERKALRKELDELKAKLAKYEKGEF